MTGNDEIDEGVQIEFFPDVDEDGLVVERQYTVVNNCHTL